MSPPTDEKSSGNVRHAGTESILVPVSVQGTVLEHAPVPAAQTASRQAAYQPVAHPDYSLSRPHADTTLNATLNPPPAVPLPTASTPTATATSAAPEPTLDDVCAMGMNGKWSKVCKLKSAVDELGEGLEFYQGPLPPNLPSGTDGVRYVLVSRDVIQNLRAEPSSPATEKSEIDAVLVLTKDGITSASDEKPAVQHVEFAGKKGEALALDGIPLSEVGAMLAESSTPAVIFPNRYAKFRHTLREPFAEFLGTMIMIMFGNGVNCQVILSGNTDVAGMQNGSYLSISWGWGIGVACAIWVSGGISGGHLNPAVTLALATFRGFPWKKVPCFIVAQILGCMCGAALVYGNYIHALNIFDPGRTKTAGLFHTAASSYMTGGSAFLNEFLATAILLCVICALGDPNNTAPPAGMAPFAILFLIVGIGASWGMQTAYALNPARDIGPRLMTLFAGYGKGEFTGWDAYWLWCPTLGPIFGALFGCFMYDTLIYTGAESPINKSIPFNAWRRRERKQSALMV